MCLGRSLIADPMFVNKAVSGKTDSIRQCMGCLYCREQLYAGMPIKCAINPRAGMEFLYSKQAVRDGSGKKAAVVGGGPAGMEATKQLVKRGFAVTLFEATDHLGGSLNLADKGQFKEQITRACETMAEKLRTLGIEFARAQRLLPIW